MAKINYSKTTWEDSPSTSTPINATNLQNIEDGLESTASHFDNLTLSDITDYSVKEYASFYLNTGGVTGVSTAETTLVINSTASNSNGSVFTLASNQVTVNKTAPFLIMGECYFNTGGNSRSEFTIWLESDGVDVPGTRSGIYERGYDSGSTGVFSTVSYVTSGTVFQMQIQRTDGGATTGYQDDNGTRLTFVEL